MHNSDRARSSAAMDLTPRPSDVCSSVNIQRGQIERGDSRIRTARVFPFIVGLALGPAGLATLHAQADSGRVTIQVVRDSSPPARPVADAAVRSGRTTVYTDRSGRAVLVLPVGGHPITVARIGSTPDSVTVVVRAKLDTVIRVTLREVTRLEQLIVSSTRSERAPEDEPIRVDVVSREDVEEKTALSPGSVAKVLGEAPGVRVQTNSPIGAASVRIQGLRGRYTRTLIDGLPVLGATTEGLGLLQTPPVDLERVEIIKGVASALYGGAALGGVVDLISRPPRIDEANVLANQTSQDATDLVVWVSDSVSAHWGYTVLAGAHRQAPRDLTGQGWSDLPGYRRIVLQPRVTWTGSSGASVFVTVGSTLEDRTGGTLPGRVAPDGHPFPLALSTQRFNLGSVGRFPLGGGTLLTVRGSATRQLLTRIFGLIRERDREATAFGEAAVTGTVGRQVWVTGAALEYDGFRSPDVTGFDQQLMTPGLFIQDTYTPAEALAITLSGRFDRHPTFGSFASPRLSILVHPIARWTARASVGKGFYAPTPFTEETAGLGLAELRPLTGLRAERALSGSVDLTAHYGALEVIGSAFFSRIDDPVALDDQPDPSGRLALVNATGPTRTSGGEVVARYHREDIDVVASYAYLRSRELDLRTGARREVPLNPRHQAGVDALFEWTEGSRIGVEAFYTGRQALADNPYRGNSPPYMLVGLLAEWRVGPVLIFANGENLFDVRQSRHDPLLLPARGADGRWTTDMWGPMGRVLNIGCQVRRRPGHEMAR